MLPSPVRFPLPVPSAAPQAVRDKVANAHARGQQAWTIVFIGKAGDLSGPYAPEKLTIAIARYDVFWNEWRDLEKSQPSCASIHLEVGFAGRPGVNRFRKIISGHHDTRDISPPENE